MAWRGPCDRWNFPSCIFLCGNQRAARPKIAKVGHRRKVSGRDQRRLACADGGGDAPLVPRGTYGLVYRPDFRVGGSVIAKVACEFDLADPWRRRGRDGLAPYSLSWRVWPAKAAPGPCYG